MSAQSTASCNSLTRDLALAGALVLVGIFSREMLVEYPNFKPIGAICLFGALFLQRTWLAILVPPLVMTVSDWRIGGPGLAQAFAVQGSLLMNLLAFRYFRARILNQPRKLTAATKSSLVNLALIIAGSVQFFLTTNLAVWLFSGWYVQDAAGLSCCFSRAWPFFFRTLAGDLVFGWAPLAVAALLAASGLLPHRTSLVAAE